MNVLRGVYEGIMFFFQKCRIVCMWSLALHFGAAAWTMASSIFPVRPCVVAVIAEVVFFGFGSKRNPPSNHSFWMGLFFL